MKRPERVAAVGEGRGAPSPRTFAGHRNRKQVDRSTQNITYKKNPNLLVGALCSRYLFSQAVARQVSSAQMSLTSVFGMGTGGPSSQSIPTYVDGFRHLYICQKRLSLLTSGDPWENRTPVTGVRGRCLNRLTNGPLVHLQGLEPGTH